jgi:1-acyl-sn-glycerol-3-phosphate acyltransferase
MRPVLQRAKIVLSIALYALLGPLGYGAFLIASTLPTRHPERRARRYQAIIRGGFRTMHAWLRLMGLIDFSPSQVSGALPETPSLLVANHPTWTDVTALMAAFPNVVTLIRETTFDRWWLRPLLRAAGQIRSPLSATGVPALNDDVARCLSLGFHVLVFPEGQRSFPDGRLRPFARAPFESAQRAGVPVVPVVLESSPEYLTKAVGVSTPPAEPSRLSVRVLDPIPPSPARSSRALRDETVARIEAARALPLIEAS